ncbi:MAG: ATP-binding protein [Nitrospirae bacterium]|nr:ATP-binding protein [Nitrospirota bacterium]MCL5420929.1 ATP-binding protein [Nitrospirota bacterium]
MSLKKKIALSFFISAFIIAILSAFEYVNFIEIRKEIRFLELTDTIRSKSLQLRRHEKNFFLNGSRASGTESEAIYAYLRELDALLTGNSALDKTGKLSMLKNDIGEYRQRFQKIETSINSLLTGLGKSGRFYDRYAKFFPLIELAIFERPLQAADYLEKVFLFPPDHRVIAELKELHGEINALRKTGEEILIVSKELDGIARQNAEKVTNISKVAILIFFPLFLVSGIGMLFFISRNVVNRLQQLITVVEKTGKGDFPRMPAPSQKDEVGVLIQKFNEMEEQLALREAEIKRKNQELLQSKKLAAIGTLASGVAHELNNPLNNIYISAQMLERETAETSSPMVKETVNDIVGQTIRVKGIVADLLEFARGREPRLREVELNELIMGAYKLASTSMDTGQITFSMETDPNGIKVDADPEQMERVFINLFTNAVSAMSGAGELKITVQREGNAVRIRVSDTGRGITADAAEKIFEPFYTTRDKGTGLGLAIVFNIIKKHGGDINVESVEGKGTSFIIKLPVRERQP